MTGFLDERFKRIQEKAEKIHDAIANRASHLPIRVGINRAGISEAARMLRRGSFKKPLFTSQHDWLRAIVIEDSSAFKTLACHIELEGVWKGRVYRWTGYGIKLSPNDDRIAETQELKLAKRNPFFVTIQLGTDVSDFSRLLEGI